MKFTTVFLIALLVRLVVAPLSYHGDVEVNYWWGVYAEKFGLKGYYDWLDFGNYGRPNQPMMTILIYLFTRYIYLTSESIFNFLNQSISLFPSNFIFWWQTHGNQILLKFPSIISDLCIGWLIFKVLVKKFGEKRSLVASSLFLFNPAVIYNSSLWGQTDSIISLLGIFGILFLSSGSLLLGYLLFTLSILTKSTLLIFLPLLVVVTIKLKPRVKKLALAVLLSLSVVYILAKPFSTSAPFNWIKYLYLHNILPGHSTQISESAFNFWSIFVAPKTMSDEVLFFSSISVYHLSIGLTGFLVALITILMYKKYSFPSLMLAMTNLTLVTFNFLTRMHERYTYPALIPMLIYSVYFPKTRILYFLISLLLLLNMYWSWSYPLTPIVYLLNLRWVQIFLALLCLYVTFFAVRVMAKKINYKS